MTRHKAVRFAVGGPNESYSGLWRLVVNKNEVYLGASGISMGFLKMSLHSSGVWTFAATKQSGATFNGNRRLEQWHAPPQHKKGITRGPSIFVPRTSTGKRYLLAKEKNKEAIWYPPPNEGEYVEFSLYFLDENISTSWNNNQKILAEIIMKNKKKIVLLASTERASSDFLQACEKIIKESVVVVSNPLAISKTETSLLWIIKSKRQVKVPIIVDLPVKLKDSTIMPLQASN